MEFGIGGLGICRFGYWGIWGKEIKGWDYWGIGDLGIVSFI